MAELVKVVVDAMGGDLAPVEPVKAAVEAVKERKDILVILTGQEEVIHSELKKYQDYPTDRIQVVNATEVKQEVLQNLLFLQFERKKILQSL